MYIYKYLYIYLIILLFNIIDYWMIKRVLYFRYNLGMVLESLGEVEAASDCMATALEVETTNPILPILSIPVTFEWFSFLGE